MRDDIDTATSGAFLAALGARVEAEVGRRMQALAHYVREIEADPEAHAAFRALVAMDPDLRAITIGGMAATRENSGALSLAGAESVVDFVNAHVVLRRECHAVPHVPPDYLRQVYARSALAHARGDKALADAREKAWLAEQARLLEFRDGPDADDQGLAPAAILAVIAGNEAVEAEFAERRAAFERRRRAALGLQPAAGPADADDPAAPAP